MKPKHMLLATTVVFIMATLGGCAGITTDTEQSATQLRWQDAKAAAQRMELEIAALIPDGNVIRVDQSPTGTLFSCTNGQHHWNGWTEVTVESGTQIESIVRSIGKQYNESDFQVRSRRGSTGVYKVQLISQREGESYLIAEGFNPNQIRIASASECFTLPDGVYPGGKF